MKKPRLVLIEWVDSICPKNRWEWLSEFEKTKSTTIFTAGYLIRNGKKTKVIAQSIHEHPEHDDISIIGIMHIPTCSVIRIIKLQPAREVDGA